LYIQVMATRALQRASRRAVLMLCAATTQLDSAASARLHTLAMDMTASDRVSLQYVYYVLSFKNKRHV